jgi:hypothetical protein
MGEEIRDAVQIPCIDSLGIDVKQGFDFAR